MLYNMPLLYFGYLIGKSLALVFSLVLLCPRHICRGLYSVRRMSVRPSVRSNVRLFVRELTFAFKFCVKVFEIL